ncbi:RNase HII [Candidatus Nanobsidianus stetteri]|uniref:Ribonuclease HII n=1 Tax=Nanobsidianus stetteri TaxID=1294122 RepID=R1FUF1_NANST|nr:RNase HII [Candidatus Nanobsidianus stetteri]
MKLILGIDEAGRGPIIGPMVIAGYCIEEEKIDLLRSLGVKDSKELTRKQREYIYNEIIKLTDKYKYIIIDPETIDYYVYRNKLNYLEFENMIKIIEEIKPDKVIIDSPLVNTKKVIEYIKNNLKINVEIIAENKADKKYPIVSAASIIAKVIRDREIDKIKEKINIDFGSGYPSDERTIEVLKKDYDKIKDYVRESWMTIKKIRKGEQKNILDFL